MWGFGYGDQNIYWKKRTIKVMPLYNFWCFACQKKVRKILAAEPAGILPCPTCGENLERNQSPATARLTEIYDNGLMSRQVERLQDIEEIREEHGKADPHEAREIPLVKTEEY